MSLKNLDGTPYKLKGSNPLMKNQRRWDEFILFNMNDANVEIVLDVKRKNKLKPRHTDFIEPKVNTIIVEAPLIEPDPIIVAPMTSQSEESSYELNDYLNNCKTIFICLPSKIETVRDDLYGNTNKISYGEKFTFEAFLLKEEDFYIEFWSNKLISQHSIVYPKNKNKRWWEVTNYIEEKDGGFLQKAMISDYNPNLS